MKNDGITRKWLVTKIGVTIKQIIPDDLSWEYLCETLPSGKYFLKGKTLNRFNIQRLISLEHTAELIPENPPGDDPSTPIDTSMETMANMVANIVNKTFEQNLNKSDSCATVIVPPWHSSYCA